MTETYSEIRTEFLTAGVMIGDYIIDRGWCIGVRLRNNLLQGQY